MNSTNIWKKRFNDKREKQSNRIVNHPQFKSKAKKKKKSLPNSFKANLLTNWIENEVDDKQCESSIDLTSFQIRRRNEDEDEDSLQIENLERLSTMKNILFLDLDNFSSFFAQLTNQLPDQTYIMAFQGSNIPWKPPSNDSIYLDLINSKHFQLMHPSGNRHDAADFALVLILGKLHGLLRKSIPFTIISGDKGFLEIIHQLKNSSRRINWFNPHQVSFEYFNQFLHLTSS